VLANALYLKAAWTAPFPEDATDDAPFYPDGPGRPGVAVPTMRGTAARNYLRGDGYQAVLLPYRDTSLAMAVVLPDGPLSELRPKVAAAGQLLISTVAHQAYIDVNEQGTEAAAATAVVMGRSAAFRAPPPATMVVDRPFLFAILDSATGVTVFLGQVSQPRSS